MADSPERVQKIQHIVECDVCLMQYDRESRKPKTLSCGHTFCYQCLVIVIKNGVCECPVCRKTTNIQSIDDLPTNFDTLATLDSLCMQCQLQPGFDTCSRCVKSLCKSCFDEHKHKFEYELSTKLNTLSSNVKKLERSCEETSSEDQVCGKLVQNIERIYRKRVKALQDERDEFIKEVKTTLDANKENDQIWKKISHFQVEKNKTFIQNTCLEEKADGLEQQCDMYFEMLEHVQQSRPVRTLVTFTPNSDIVKLGDLSVAKPQPRKKLISWSKLNRIKEVKFITCIRVPSFERGLVLGGITARRGNIIVADYYNHTVHSIDNKLKVTSFGGMGYQNHEFLYPFDVAVSSENELYISDELNNRVQVVDCNGKFLRTLHLTKSSLEIAVRPKGLAFDKRDVLYICNALSKSIVVALKNGTVLRMVGRDVLDKSQPEYVTVTNNRIVMSDMLGSVFIFDNSGYLVTSVLGGITNHKIKVRGIASNDHDEIFMATSCGGILILDEEGETLKKLEKPEVLLGVGLKDPSGATFSSRGDFYICDQKHGIVKFKVVRYFNFYGGYLLIATAVAFLLFAIYFKLYIPW